MPADALLQRYAGQGGAYTDCFETVVPHRVALPAYIEAFYTTWLFRLERAVLTVSLRRRITDGDVTALAAGAGHFAAWRVEARAADEVLLCDLSKRTRSYLAVADADGAGTRLIFGSAVVPPVARPEAGLGKGFDLLLPLHRLYSRQLLKATARKLQG